MTTFGDILKQAEQSGATFELLPADTYVAKIIESDYQNSSNGKPQIKTRWEVVIGPKAGFKGLWNYFTLTVDNPNAMAIFYRQITALGITSDFLQSLANVDPATAMKHIASALDGRMASIKVKVDTEWQNNKIERISALPPNFQATAAVTGPSDPFAAAARPVAPAPAPPTAPVVTAPPVAAPVAPNAPVAPTAPVDSTPVAQSAPVAPDVPTVPSSDNALPPPPF